jgi:hypothetical protein
MTDKDILNIQNSIRRVVDNEPNGQLFPQLYLKDSENKRYMMDIPQTFLESDDNMNAMLKIITSVITQYKATSGAFVSTAWKVNGKHEPGETLEQTAERVMSEEEPVEIIVMVICDMSDNARVIFANVDREDGFTKLGPWETMSGQHIFSGLVTAMVPAFNVSRGLN